MSIALIITHLSQANMQCTAPRLPHNNSHMYYSRQLLCITYSGGLIKVNVHPACNDRAMMIALKQNAEDGNVFRRIRGFVFTPLVQFHTWLINCARECK